jgi:hypothetical protein
MRAAFRICATVIGLALSMATASLGSSLSAEPALGTPAASLMACCKVCSKGKACGNSCISQDKVCHQPPGCACDA